MGNQASKFEDISETLLNDLDRQGFARIQNAINPSECEVVANFYDDPDINFRSKINMSRYNFGQGEYQYFAYPLPNVIQQLRTDFYRLLAPVADQWESRLGNSTTWPENLLELTNECHENGQKRPTPLLLKYGPGDYNCLHQDLYGPIHFPLQVIFLLSKPQNEFEGGELMLVEQRPRMQSRGTIIPLNQGDAAVIPVRERPRLGSRGYHRVNMRHGVSEVRKGERFTLGLIFHDAE